MTAATTGQAIKQRLRVELVAAMKSRDSVAVTALRSALGVLDNAEAVDSSHAPPAEPGIIAGGVVGLGASEVPRRELTADEATEVVRGEADRWEALAADYERLGRADEAANLRHQAGVLLGLLPAV